MTDINVLWQGPAALGEGPVWHPQTGLLYWIDIADPTLHQFNIQNQQHQSWPMPQIIGALAPAQDGHLIAALGKCVVRICMPSGEIEELIRVLPEDSELRLNDGKCDALGRFWVGVAHVTTDHPQGGLFCIDTDGMLLHKEKGITISNGLGWSPDQTAFYYTNSLTREIYRYAFDVERGDIRFRQLFAKINGEAQPDGLTVDSEGYVWSALWDGHKLVRYAPDGTIDREIVMPVQRPTSCMFGGDDYQTLFVTSCSADLGETTALPGPAGAVFSIDVGVTGLPEFVGCF